MACGGNERRKAHAWYSACDACSKLMSKLPCLGVGAIDVVEWIGEAVKVHHDLLELGVVGLSPGIPRLPREGVTARCITPQMARGGMSHGAARRFPVRMTQPMPQP